MAKPDVLAGMDPNLIASLRAKMNNDGTDVGDYMSEITSQDLPTPDTDDPDVATAPTSTGAGLAAGAPADDALPDAIGALRTPEMAKADAHLQEVIQQIIAKQNQPTRAEAYAILGGGTPGMRQSFGEIMGAGLAKAAPLVEQRENSLDNLRIKAAELESGTATRQSQAAATQALARQKMMLNEEKRGDYLASRGLMLTPDGVRTVDPTLLDAASKRAGAVAQAQYNAKNPDANTDFGKIVNTPVSPAGAAPLAPDASSVAPTNAPSVAAPNAGGTPSADGSPTPDGSNVLAADGKTITTYTPLSASGYLVAPDDPSVVQMNAKLDNLAAAKGQDFANVVKSLIDGRMGVSGLQRDKKDAYTRAANAIDPLFDASDANTRVKERVNLTSGKDYQSLQALNTVAGHLNKFLDAADKLKNASGFPFATSWNAVANKYESSTGDDSLKNFNLTRSAVSDELSRAYKGGVISDSEKADWQENLDSAGSPEQFKGAVKTMADLLQSKINTMVQAAKVNMGPGGHDIQFIAPEAQKLFTKFESNGAKDGAKIANTPDPQFTPVTIAKGAKQVVIKNKAALDDAMSKGWQVK